MEWFEIVSGGASLLGLIVSCIALFKANKALSVVNDLRVQVNDNHKHELQMNNVTSQKVNQAAGDINNG